MKSLSNINIIITIIFIETMLNKQKTYYIINDKILCVKLFMLYG